MVKCLYEEKWGKWRRRCDLLGNYWLFWHIFRRRTCCLQSAAEVVASEATDKRGCCIYSQRKLLNEAGHGVGTPLECINQCANISYLTRKRWKFYSAWAKFYKQNTWSDEIPYIPMGEKMYFVTDHEPLETWLKIFQYWPPDYSNCLWHCQCRGRGTTDPLWNMTLQIFLGFSGEIQTPQCNFYWVCFLYQLQL